MKVCLTLTVHVFGKYMCISLKQLGKVSYLKGLGVSGNEGFVLFIKPFWGKRK